MRWIAVLLVFLALVAAVSREAKGEVFSLHWNATFVPVNHEPVVGNLVARYRIQLEPRIDYKRFHYVAEMKAWGGQKWRNRSLLGDGFVEKYRNSDWSVETWRFAILHRLTFDLFGDRLGIYTEYYMPQDRHSWGGHGMERHYYLLTGIRGKIFP